MNTTAWIVCKAFLQKCPDDKIKALTALFSDDNQKILEQLPDRFFKDPANGVQTFEDKVKEIHYSWFAPFFRALPESEIRLFLSSLDNLQADGLKKLLLFGNFLQSLNPLAQDFLQKELYQSLLEPQEEVLPIECLPDSPLNVLLEKDSADLLAFIDFFGLHDLAVETRQIIETSKLKQIYKALSTHEQNYLKLILQRKEQIIFKRMALSNWDGNPQTLKALIHQRGLNRLGKTLSWQSQNLLWHLIHKLDMERGLTLKKLSTPFEHERAGEILFSQAVDIINYMQNLEPRRR
jgi:hypothetical protein